MRTPAFRGRGGLSADLHADVVHYEAIDVRRLLHNLAEGLAATVARLAVYADETRGLARLALLERCCELERVGGDDAVVVVGRGDERGGIRDPRAETVEGGIGTQVAEHLGAVGTGAIVRRPVPPDGEAVVAEHVHDAHLRDADLKEFGPLRHACPDEQSAIAAAHDGKMGRVGVAVGDEPLGGGYEIIEDILLAHLGPRLMPLLPVLAAAAETRHGIDAAALEERDAGVGEIGAHGDGEAAVAVEQERVAPIELEALAVGQEKRHAGAVLAGDEDLPRLISIGIEIDLRAGEDPAVSSLDIETVNGGGDGERREREETLPPTPLGAESRGAYRRELHLAQAAAGEVGHVGMAAGVPAIREQHLVSPHESDILKHAPVLGHHLAPSGTSRTVQGGDHQPVARSPVIGHEKDGIADDLDGRVLEIHVVSHLDETRVGHSEVAHIESVAIALAALVEEHHSLLVIDADIVEA